MHQGTRTFFRGLLVGGVGLTALQVIAAGAELDTGSRLIPYTGTLELNGAAYNGVVDLQVIVSAEGTPDGGTCSQTETHSEVTVYSGRFSINIGEVSGVPSCIFDGSAVYVTLAVREPGGTFATLSGRQRIRPVPFALWAAEGGNFKVDGTLTTTARAIIGGSDLHLGTNDGRDQGSNTQQRALVHTGSDALYINYGGDFEGGTIVQSNLGITGTLTATSADSNLKRVVVPNGTPTPSYSASGWLTSNDEYRLRLWTNTTDATRSYGIGIQNSALFYNTDGAHNFYYQGSPALSIGSTSTTVHQNLSVSGTATITGNTTVSGTLSHATSCPGSPTWNVARGNSRLCVYDDATSNTWPAAARRCWSEYNGADLCSLSQLQTACWASGTNSVSSNRWLKDRTADDEAVRTNSTNCDNPDEVSVWTNTYGGYCCLLLRSDG